MLRKLVFLSGILLSAQFALPGAAAQEPAIRAAGDAVIEAFKGDDLAVIEARFDGAMKRALPHDKFVAVMSEVKRKIGTLKLCAAPVFQQIGGIGVFDYPCEFSLSKATIRLPFNADATLAGLSFPPPKP